MSFHPLSLVYLGVNRKEVDFLNRNLKGNTLYEYGVEEASAHPKWMINQVKS